MEQALKDFFTNLVQKSGDDTAKKVSDNTAKKIGESEERLAASVTAQICESQTQVETHVDE